MVRHRLLLLRLGLLLADSVAAVLLFAVVSIARFDGGWREAWMAAGGPWWVWAVSYGALWAGAEWLQELDRIRARWTMRAEVMAIVRATVLVAVSMFSLLFLVHAPQVSRQFLIMLFSAQLVFSVVQRRVLRSLLVRGRKRGIGERRVLILGTGPDARLLADRLERHPALGYVVVGHLGGAAHVGRPVLGPLDAIEETMHALVIDEVAAALDTADIAYLEPVTSLCTQEGKLLRVLVSPGGVPIVGGRVESLDGLEIVTFASGPERILGLLAKRVIDILLAGLALLVLSPVMLALGIAVHVGDPGPILFRQVRVGLHGRPFRMLKFRSMVAGAEERLYELSDQNEISGPAFKVINDPRVTPVGRFLRRSSLDELPQFWNVLIGHMSIVGPRPPLPGETSGYDLWHRRRLSMKPGITGLWQVSARLEQEFDRWVELDLVYIDRWSLWLDLKIMLRTVPAMLSGR